MKKSEILISIFIVFLVMYFYFFDIKSIFRVTNRKILSFDLPKIVDLSVYLPNNSEIGKFEVWDLRPLSQKQAIKINYNPKILEKSKKLLKVNFKLKIVDGIPSVINVFNDKYRWEFYGVVMTMKGRRAVFYNPFLKRNGLKLIGVRENLDSYLKLVDLSDDSATLEFNMGNKYKKFVLSIFDVESIDKRGIK